ncbi:MAG: FFLEELY motif protein [Rehaibacterium terrae]|uniref:FFLEELY motif protein n=1 Tax=Rehaibacterium terrae TaxID=1341696 RepID=UPI0039197CA5
MPIEMPTDRSRTLAETAVERARWRVGRRLAWHQALHDPQREPRNRSPWLPPLRRWQAARLATGFADLLAAPRTRPAAEFFLSDLYGDHDFSGRDRDVARVVPLMLRLLPPALLEALADAIALGALSHAFDLRIAEALEAEGGGTLEIDQVRYARAYRQVGCPRLRRHQIALIVRVGRTLDRAVHKQGVERLLKLSRLPARAAGLGELQGFLERGFAAFRRLDGAEDFLQVIAGREYEVSRRLFAGHPRPFG